MALSPQDIREYTFKTGRRGYEPGDVDRFRTEVADALEAAQNEAAAMEARARAAVARLQELTKSQGSGATATSTDVSEAPKPPPAVDVQATVDDSETISRTLLLAQRTADTTIAAAREEAERVRAQAAAAADEVRAEADREAAELTERAKEDARRSGEDERVRVEGEVQALLARRDFLESDVDHLEQFIAAQRERITEAVGELKALVERVPNGLATMRRPLLSAAAHEDPPAPPPAPSSGSASPPPASPPPASPPAEAAGVDETGDVWAARDPDEGSDRGLLGPASD